MRLNFCEFSKDQLLILHDIFNTLYKIYDFEEILNVYDVFKKDFLGPTISSPQKIKREHLQPITNQEDFLTKYNDFEYQVGIDVPVLLTPDSNFRGTVFIVAEDPLRDFDNLSNAIRMSTPFGIHMQEFRTKILPIYWEVIEHFLNQGFSVYVTDFYKLWIKHKNKPKLRLKADIYDNLYTAFLKEKEAFQPQLIISFGKPASLQVMRIGGETKSVAFPHPTRTANGEWKKLLKAFYQQDDIRCTDQNKMRYMKQLIESTTAINALANRAGPCKINQL